MKHEDDQFDILVTNLQCLREDRDEIEKFEKKWLKIAQDRYSELAEKMRRELPEWKHYLETLNLDNWQEGELYELIEDDLKDQIAKEVRKHPAPNE